MNALSRLVSVSTFMAFATAFSSLFAEPVRILEQPHSVIAVENCTARFTAIAAGDRTAYQWLRDGLPIDGATNSELVLLHVSLQDNGASFQVHVWNGENFLASSNAILNVILDTPPPPAFKAIYAGPASNTLLLTFDAPCGGLNPTYAEDIFSYLLSEGGIWSAQLQGLGDMVLLTTTPLAPDVMQWLRIDNVVDSTNVNFYPVSLRCPVRILEQPRDHVVILGQQVTLSATAYSFYTNVTYQWEWRDALAPSFTTVTGATQATYRFYPYTCAQSGEYRCRIATGECVTYSDSAWVDVFCDCDPPRVVGVTALTSLEGLLISFTEGVTPGTATDIFNYEIAGLEVLGAELREPYRVFLRTSPQTPGQLYTLMVNGVTDYGDASCGANEVHSTMNFRAPLFVPGLVRCDIWTNIWSGSVWDLMYNARFPNSPDRVEYLNAFELPRFRDDWYGARLSALLVPQRDAEYRFFIPTSGDARFTLSKDEDLNVNFPSPYYRTGRPRDFSVSTVSRTLVAGEKYAVELLIVPGDFPDHGAVAWQASFGVNPQQPIPGTYLGAFADTLATSLEIVEQPTDFTSEVDCKAAFSVRAEAQPAVPISYQWQRDGEDIPGANDPIYRTDFLAPVDNNAAFRCRVFAPGTNVTSDAAVLSLGGDVAMPAAEGAFAITSNQVRLIFNHPVFPGGLDTYRFEPPLNVLNTESFPFDPSLTILSPHVILTTDVVAPGVAYKLIVNEIFDMSGNTVTTPTTVDVHVATAADLQAWRSGNKLIVHWPRAELGLLQSAASPAGPWVDLPDARTPFIVDAIGDWCSDTVRQPHRFFRLRYDP